MDAKVIEQELATSSYSQVAEELETLSDNFLLTLIDAKSNRVGDTAADLLDSRGKQDAIIDAILNSTIRTVPGKIRATSILHRWGKRLPRAEEVYRRLLSDGNAKVVDNALFGLTFLQKKENVPFIEQARAQTTLGNEAIRQFDQAIEGLVKGNPLIYSPHFRDSDNVW